MLAAPIVHRIGYPLHFGFLYLFVISTVTLTGPWSLESVEAQSDAGTQTAREPAEFAAGEAKQVADIRPSSFQEITPGETTLGQLKAVFGEPQSEQANGKESLLIYKVGPFPKVEFVTSEDVVVSIVVHLGTPSQPKDIEAELGLDGFVPAPIEGEQGEQLGQVYPERGVVLGFTPAANPPTVAQLVLEPIAAEFFVMRAKNSGEFQYEQKIDDLGYALQIDDEQPEVHWLRARVLSDAGRYDLALEAIEKSLEQEPNDPQFQLLQAELELKVDRHAEAMRNVKRVLAQQKLPALVLARAKLLHGNLAVLGSVRDYETALRSHLSAIELATPLASSNRTSERRAAKRILIEAHMAVAEDITLGDRPDKAEAAPKWLAKARELVDDAIENEEADPVLRLELFQHAMAAYRGMKGAVDPSEVVAEARELGEQLIADADDRLRRQKLQWVMVEMYFDAIRIQRVRGATDEAVQYAKAATDMIHELEGKWPHTSQTRYMIGRLFFYTGSMLAIRSKDHAAAVRWYERSLPYFQKEIPESFEFEAGRHGQRLVSMGVSYWETNVKEEAINISELGLEFMDQARVRGKLESQALVVPYGNLAAMYKAVGRHDEADKMSAKAARLEKPSSNPSKSR